MRDGFRSKTGFLDSMLNHFVKDSRIYYFYFSSAYFFIFLMYFEISDRNPKIYHRSNHYYDLQLYNYHSFIYNQESDWVYGFYAFCCVQFFLLCLLNVAELCPLIIFRLIHLSLLFIKTLFYVIKLANSHICFTPPIFF
jgi:hypothetical protein